MAKKEKGLINYIKLHAPREMEYYVPMEKQKDKVKFVSRIERIIRGSMEYRDYIKFLKENVGLDSCIFFQNITKDPENIRGKHVTLEIHHEPLTLFDIVMAVVNKYEEEGLAMNALLIADEVMELHYANKVGLVPVSKTAHELIHNTNKLFVPLNFVYGEYSQFMDEYYEYIDDDVFSKVKEKVEKTKNIDKETFDALTKEFIEYDVEGYDDINKFEEEISEEDKEIRASELENIA